MRRNYYRSKVKGQKSRAGKRKIGYPVECDAKKCAQKIIFLPTRTGSKMPVNYSSLSESDIHEINTGAYVFYSKEAGHEPHFATCTEPNRFRKKKGKSKKVRNVKGKV